LDTTDLVFETLDTDTGGFLKGIDVDFATGIFFPGIVAESVITIEDERAAAWFNNAFLTGSVSEAASFNKTFCLVLVFIKFGSVIVMTIYTYSLLGNETASLNLTSRNKVEQ
jgi:hypothetical protein